MLEHLLDFEPPIESADHVVPVSRVPAPDLVAAQQGTLDWLTAVGAPTEDSADAQLAASLAQQAFTAVTTSTPTPDQHAALLQLKTPPAVRHLVGMLTAYDWAFVEQARELRGHKTINGLGKCVASMPSWEFFRLVQKYGHAEVHSEGFLRDFQRRFPHLSPNKV
jgi:hypothetical protein